MIRFGSFGILLLLVKIYVFILNIIVKLLLVVLLINDVMKGCLYIIFILYIVGFVIFINVVKLVENVNDFSFLFFVWKNILKVVFVWFILEI